MGSLGTFAGSVPGGAKTTERTAAGSPLGLLLLIGTRGTRSAAKVIMFAGSRAGFVGMVRHGLVEKGISGHALFVNASIAIFTRITGPGRRVRALLLLLLLFHLAPQLCQTDLLVIFGATGVIGKQLVGVLDFLELILGLVSQRFVFDLVGMAFQHEFPMGGFDFGQSGIFGDA